MHSSFLLRCPVHITITVSTMMVHWNMQFTFTIRYKNKHAYDMTMSEVQMYLIKKHGKQKLKGK